MVGRVLLRPNAELHPRGGATVCVGGARGGQLPFWRIVPGNRDRKEEAGAGNCTHCPHATLLPWSPGGRVGGGGNHQGSNILEPLETRTRCRCVSDGREIDNGKNPTGDHLLGVIWFHVAVVLADTLRFPLLSRLLSVKWIRIVFKDDHLKKKKKEATTVIKLKGKNNKMETVDRFYSMDLLLSIIKLYPFLIMTVLHIFTSKVVII